MNIRLSKQLVLYTVFSVMIIFGLNGCATQQEQAKEKENTKSRARAHTDLGAVYFQQKQLEVALEEFTIATQIDASYAAAYNGLGLVNAALGRDDVADTHYKKAIQLEPNNSESRNNYGSFLCSRNRIDESIPQFLAAVKNPLYATPVIAYTNAGICSLRKKESTSGEAYLQKALELEPLSGVAAYHLANSQFKRKDALSAKKTIQNVMLAQPGPELLWLAIQIERVLGAKDAEASYALQLRSMYPDSEQAKLLQNGR